MNFLALTVLTELDDYLFETLGDDPMADLIKDKELPVGDRKRVLGDIIVI